MANKWQYFISERHRRIQAMWRFFFAGWGLFFTLILAVSPFVFRNMAWSILDAVDIEALRQNNMSIANLKMNGTDKNGEPFAITTRAAFQKFSQPNIIYFEAPVAQVVRAQNGKKIKDKISAQMGKLLKNERRVVLSDDVRVESSDGTTARANEMEIDLK